MSEPSSPTQNKEDSSEIARGEQPPKHGWDQYFRFHPIAFTQFLLGEVNSAKADKKKRDYYTDFIRRYFPIAFFVLIIAVFSAVLLHQIGFFDSDRVIAFFTFVLAALGLIQLVTIYRQWRVMHDQNAILIEQGKQTDAMIEQMKLENRAWLAILNLKIKPLSAGYRKVVCTIDVKNSGKTPGKIYAGLVKHYVRPTDVPGNVVIHEFESEPSQPQVHNVNPGEGITIEMEPLGEVDDLHIEDIRLGNIHLHILARFAYRTISSGETDEEKAFFTSKGLGSEMRRRANYCSIHNRHQDVEMT